MVTATKTKEFDVVGAVIDFEGGDMSPNRVIEFFSHLLKTGMAWKLQGSYGRAAQSLIAEGYLERDGTILRYPQESE
jgi:hypothetical protein